VNDPSIPFIKPNPQAPWWRARARGARRTYARARRGMAQAGQIKRWNSELNWREFWHGRTFLESGPRLIQVGTNWTCNLKCSFCRLTMEWTQNELKKLPARELQISERVFDVVRRLLPRAEMMTLTPLGEPLLWSGLGKLLDFHASVGSRNLAFTTNGMLLNERNVERIIQGQLSHLYVSIDSNDPEIYAGMRVQGELGVVEEGVRRLAARKQQLGLDWPRMTVNATFMKRNIPQLPSMVGWAKELGFDEISVQLMEIENPEQEPEFLGYCPEMARENILEALARGREIGMMVRPHLALRNLISADSEGRQVSEHQYTAASPIMPEERKLHGGAGDGSYASTVTVGQADAPGCATCGAGELADAQHAEAERLASDPWLDMRGKTLVEKCHYPWYNLLIDTDGDARPCCWADASWGNLNELDFEEVWNGEKAQRMRRDFLANHIPESCRKKHCRVDL